MVCKHCAGYGDFGILAAGTTMSFTSVRRWRFGWLVAGLVLAGTTAGVLAQKNTGGKLPGVTLPEPKAVKAPLVAGWPGEIVGLLQGKEYARARAAIDRLEAAKVPADADTRAFHDLVRALSLRLEGKSAEAVALIEKRLKADPSSAWTAKLRGELTAARLGGGKPDLAAALARADVEGLLGGQRKDSIAQVYRGFARQLLEPTEALTAPDYAAARPFLVQARDVAESRELKDELSLQLATAAMEQGAFGEALGDLQRLSKEETRPVLKRHAHFQLGLAQFGVGAYVEARRTWTDLARAMESEKAKDSDTQATMNNCLYAIAMSYGLQMEWRLEPVPYVAPLPARPLPAGDAAYLNRLTAATNKALAADPDNPRAVRAAFTLGRMLAQARPADAVGVLQDFLAGKSYMAVSDTAKKELAEFKPQALLMLAQALRSLERYDDAQAAYRDYTTKYPDGAGSAAALQAVIDVEIDKANALLRDKKYGEFRDALKRFVAANPLQPTVPRLLFRIGDAWATEKNWSEAVAAWKLVAARFPDNIEADEARYRTGLVLETSLGDLTQAIEVYRSVKNDPWRPSAQQRISIMENKSLAVVTPRVFRSNETARLKISTRNIEKLSFSAYRIDPESYFRKKHLLGNVEQLDIGLVKPDAEWSAEVPGQARYKPVDVEYDLKTLALPGVWVVKVTDEKTFQATTMVIGSDLDAIVKTSRDQLLVYVQNMVTGESKPAARLLVSDGANVLVDDKTGADGVLLKDWPGPRPNRFAHRVLVMDGAHVATTQNAATPAESARGLSAKALILTDRPAYRPGQTVQLRGIVREINQSRYDTREGAVYTLEVADSRGRRLQSRPVTISKFGTFSATVPLDGSAPLGNYAVRLFQQGGSSFGGQFRVEEYELPKVVLGVELPQTIYERGEKVTGKVSARYAYGTPLAGRLVQVSLPDGRVLALTTDATGTAPFELPTDELNENSQYSISAVLPDEGVGSAVQFAIPGASFTASLKASRGTYLVDETIPLAIRTTDALGKPTGQTLALVLSRRSNESGRAIEQEVRRLAVTTDPKTGQATARLVVDDKRGGTHVVRLLGTDKFGRPVTTELVLDISGMDDPNGLRLLADQTSWKLGTRASATLHARHQAGPVLVCFEADRMLGYQILPVKQGDNTLAWQVADNQFPNMTVTATRMRQQVQETARLDVKVQRGLQVAIKPLTENVKPGQPVEVELTATDQNGGPAEAELSLGLVDKALLRLFGENRPNLQDYFYDQSRTGAFATITTNIFKYTPATSRVPESIVEEQERLQAQTLNLISRDRARETARSFAFAPQAPASAAAPAMVADALGVAPARSAGDPKPAAPGGMMGRPMAGGMGGMGGGGRGGKPEGRAEAGQLAELKEKQESDQKVAAKRRLGKADMDEAADKNAIMLGVQAIPAEGFGTTGKAGEEAPARQQLIETAYWNPAIMTDTNGRAKVTLTAPNALGEYEFDGNGVTAADTLVGQATADLAVRKPFFIELTLPTHLTEGDRIKPTARLHHQGVKGEVAVTLERYANGQATREPRTIKLEADGVTNLAFEEFTVPATRELRFEATAKAGETTDKETRTVPASPWGTPVLASANGSARDDQTVFIELPEGRPYENLAMMVSLAPTLQRQVLEAALGADLWPMPRSRWGCIMPPPWDTTADRAADLMAATQALAYLRQVGGSSAVDQGRLVDRTRGLVAELAARQNEDGGWPLTAPGPKRLQTPAQPAGSDPHVSAKVLLALALARDTAVVDPADSIAKAAAFVKTNAARARPWQVAALAYVGQVGFEELNALSRDRQSLDSAELACLALAWVRIDRRSMADEVITTLLTRSRTSPAQPGKPVERYWAAGVVGPELTTAWVAWALAQTRPAAEQLPEVINWLNHRRLGPGWIPFETKGPAVAALAGWYGRAQAAEDRYRMTIRVNDQPLDQLSVDGTQGSTIRLWNVPAAIVKAGRNKVSFDVEGRARYGFSVQLSGFSPSYTAEQKPDGKPFTIHSRQVLAAAPELDGTRLPTGFGTAVNPTEFQNVVSQLPPGGKARVQLQVRRSAGVPQQLHSGDLVVVEEPLPSGARLVEGSVEGNVLRTEQELGLLRFYIDPNTLGLTTLNYEIFGAFEGRSRLRPSRVYTISQPALAHASSELALTILPPGTKSTDPYKPTPDELYARGRKHFEKGRLAEAATALEALSAGYTLQDEPARESARMLLDAHIAAKEPRKIVQDFEVLKLKAPDLVLPMEKIRQVGDSYAAIGEHERAWLVWRAVLDAGYLDEAQLGQTLRQFNRPLEAAVYLINTWRAYPGSAAQQSDFFGLSRWLSQLAADSIGNPDLRRQLVAADVTRSELVAQAIALTQLFLTLSPDDPLGDEANLALIGDLATLEANETVVKVAAQAARLYPKSRFLDSFQFGEALARYNLGELDQAIGIARKIADTTYEEPGGVRRQSPNRGQALFIMGQIYDARRSFPQALDQYRQVAGQFPDAAVAVKALERKALGIPEVSVVPIKPDQKAVAASLKVNYRNLESLDLKVYPVDLLRLYLSRQNLDQIAAVDLAGIKPLMEQSVKLGDGKDYADKAHEMQLQLPGEGAYLVMIRGGELFTSGIVLATPIELEVMEEPAAGRVRISAREFGTGKPLPKLQVKLSASSGGGFRDGTTDMRGVFVADGLGGLATVVVRQSAGRYAFFRGKTPLGGQMVQNFISNAPPAPTQGGQNGQMPGGQPLADQPLDQNLRGLNNQNSLKQMERLNERYKNEFRKGVQIQSVK